MFTVVMMAAVAVTSLVLQLLAMLLLLLHAAVMMIRNTLSSTEPATDNSSAVIVTALPQTEHAVKLVDALDVLGSAQWLPIASDLVATAVHAVVRQSHVAVNITIAGGITVESMQSIMKHTNIKHLHLQLAAVTPDVITAISDMVMQQSLASKCVASCTIDNFERLDSATAKALLQHMPDTLHTLTIRQAQHARFVVRQSGAVFCPRSVKTLSITNIGFEMVLLEGLEKLYTIDCSAHAWDSVPSTLLELHTTNMKFALPALPHGLLKLQMHSVNRVMDIPLDNIPSTVTHLKLAETQTIRVPEWPPQLQVLDVGAQYYHRLDALPDTITELYVKLSRKGAPRYHLETLPPQLRVLDICNLELSADIVLPETLEVLRLDTFWGLVPELPHGLTELKLSGFFHKQLSVALPATLQILDLGWYYELQTVLDDTPLPASLHTLYVFEHYKHSVDHLRPAIQVHRSTPRYDVLHCEVW